MIAFKLCVTVKRGLAALLFVAAFAASSHAQSTFGSIRGTAQDNSGAVVPDTQITLHSMDQNTDREVRTDAAGDYLIENVLAGTYRILALHDGFAETVVSGITLASRQDLRVTLTMKIAEQATTVEVTTTSNQINTENASLGDSKDTAQIGELPLNFRASTTSPLAALTTSANVQTDNQGNVAVGAATANMVGFSVDGISTVNVFNSAAGANPYPSSEGIAELKVTAFNNNAEFAQVGDVTFTTKAGTNAFHGSAFEYLQNNVLDARVYNFSEKAPKQFNTFGGSFGGPLSVPFVYNGHNRTFFFVDYEGNRRNTSLAEQYTVPSALDRMGNLNDLLTTFPTSNGNPVPLIDPYTGQAYANNTIPQQSISQFAKTLLNTYYPLPNLPTTTAGAVNYQTLVPIPSRTNGIDGRIDQVINSKQQVYARFNWKNLLVNVVNPLLPNDVDSEHDRSFLISHNYVISSRLVNEFRFGFTDTTLAPNFPIEGAQALSGLGVQLGGAQGVNVSNHPTDEGFPTINFTDGTNFTPIGRDHVGPTVSTTKELADNINYTRGKHTFRAGVDVRWVRFEVPEIETPSDDYGLFTFNQNTFTNSSFGDLLLGSPNTAYFAVTGPRDNAGGAQTGIYGQDEWQVNDRLTVNFGLRWELLPPFVDKNGIQANFDPNYSGPGADGQGAIVVNNILLNGLKPAPDFLASFNACGLAGINPNYNASTCTPVVSNGQDHLPAGLRQTYLRNFDPRISFAYRPFRDNKTVIRAGFGIFTVTALGQLQNNNESNPEASVNTWLNNPSASSPALGMVHTPQFSFPQVAPPGAGFQFGGGELEQATSPNYRDAQSAQWNVTIERELTPSTSVRVSYVGMNSYRLNVTENLNQQAPTTVEAPLPNPNPIPFPNWGVIFNTANLGGNNYQAVELEATHRLSRGLSYQANYTWAHNISDAQGDAPTAFVGETNYGLAVLNHFDIHANRGNVEGTRRQRALVTGTYELPFGKGRQWMNSSPVMNAILGNWNVNTITLLETGPYLTPTDSVTYDQTNTDPAGDGSIVRPDRVGNPIPAHRSTSDYFNIAAFAHTPPGAGRIGNAGVGSLEAPGTIAVSGGLAKILIDREKWRIRFESTFTNVLNHTNFAPPPTNINNPGAFGVLTAAQTTENAGNRTGQAALRVEF
ncbi:carboxypeptidase-like regulatory domain-containing protein [Acidicapsa acidisoli]|uniref:carboxypeptidase-like regulatory domain-containing protein n=1 Tax=Acidicapsa acidisoli TaxID=1615681 RepID=UPI0021E019D8|nr:carboxypeptidase-like regulatory domain-containing protein [Acidicapsa acidisoli]